MDPGRDHLLMGTHDDTTMMQQALRLARRAVGRTSPNPMVGAVIVAGDEIVGSGYHARAGEAHAEVVALRKAGTRARGATLYVNLEPCAHTGRTGPCTEALVDAGIRRVVVAMRDPDPKVDGRGIARLREAGIEVEIGLLEDRALRLNESYVKHRRTGIPFVTLKWAMSLDGKIGADRGSATALTGEEARRFAHSLRNTHDAVLVGVQTVLADDPQLTCRIPGGRNPLRVVLDSRLRTPPDARVAAGVVEAPTLIATTATALPAQVEAMRRVGVEVLVLDQAPQGVDLSALMEELGRRGVQSVLIEGGGTVNASALAAGVVDKVVALVAPRLIGGTLAPTPVDGPGLAGVTGAVRLSEVRTRKLGKDILIEGKVEDRCSQAL